MKEYLTEFNKLISECEKLYKGNRSDIGEWIYSQERVNNYSDLNRVAKNCLFRIKRGVSIKRYEIEEKGEME